MDSMYDSYAYGIRTMRADCFLFIFLFEIQNLIFSPNRNLMILILFHHYLSLHPLNLLLFSPACFGWKFSFFIAAELLDFRIIL